MKGKACFFSVLGFLFASNIRANESAAVAPSKPLASVEGSKVYIAPLWEYGHSEWGNRTSQNGSLWGASVGYSYSERNSIYVNLEFTGAAGRWKGSAGNDPTREYVTELRLGYVGAFPCERFTLTPFVGIGSYVFNQTISGGPNFNSYFWYVPIGVSLEYRISKSFAIGLMGFGAPTFAGSYKINYRANAPTDALWKVELPLTYYGSLPFELSIVPFAKQWAYLANEELIKQRNTYYGLKIGFGYHF